MPHPNESKAQARFAGVPVGGTFHFGTPTKWVKTGSNAARAVGDPPPKALYFGTDWLVQPCIDGLPLDTQRQQ